MADVSHKELSQNIKNAESQILKEWEKRVRQSLPQEKEEATLALRDHLPRFLEELEKQLESSVPRATSETMSEQAKAHGKQRAVQSKLTLPEVIYEYEILRRTIFDQLEINKPLNPNQREWVLSKIAEGIALAADEYANVKLSGAQMERQAAREGEQKYRDLVNELDHAVAWEVESKSLKFQFVGKRAEQLLGYPIKEWVQYPDFFIKHSHPDDVPKLQEMRVIATKIPMPVRIEHRLYTQSGVELWFQTGMSVEKSKGGSPEVFRGLSVDITPFKATHVESEKRLAELRAVIESIPEAIYIGDETGIKLANQAALDQLGFDTFEELNQNIKRLNELVQNRDPQTCRLLRPDEIPFAQALQGKRVLLETLIQHLKTGDERLIRSAAAPIFYRGRKIGAVCINTDITEARRALETRRLLSESTLALYSSLDPDETLSKLAKLIVPQFASWCIIDLFEGEKLRRVAVLHEDPKMAEVVKEFQTLSPQLDAAGGSAKALREGKSFIFPDHLGPTDSKLFFELGASDPYQVDLIRKMGVSSYLVTPLFSRDKRIGVMTWVSSHGRLFTQEDLNLAEEVAHKSAMAVENAQLHAQLEKTISALREERNLQERFVATLTHDLRNPLSAIKTNAAILRRYPNRPDAVEKTSVRVLNSTEHADRLIENLLDLYRVKAGQSYPVNLIEGDVVPLCRELLDELAITNGDRFRLKAPSSIMARFDPNALRRALENLIVNAVKYGKEGAPIRINVDQTPDNILFKVNNEGEPIPKENFPKLFTPFVRLEANSKQKGWGIGLVLVKSIIEAHGGDVRVESSQKEGTTFTLILPNPGT